MAIDPEFGRRLRTAKREWETRHDRALPNKELAERVRDVAGVESLSGQAVGQWLNEGQEPSSLALLRALAVVLEVSVERLVGVPETPYRAPAADFPLEPEDAYTRVDFSATEEPRRKRRGGGSA